MKTKIGSLGMILVLSPSLGCDIEGEYHDGPDASARPEATVEAVATDSLIQENNPTLDPSFIRGGTESAHSGIVQISIAGIGGCTGFFLDDHTIVTAAHCVPGSGNVGGTPVVATISAFRMGASNPTLVWNGSVTYERHPDYESYWYQSADHDIAYLRNYTSSVWPGTSYNDYLRIYQDYGSRINEVKLWGRGYNTHSGNGNGVLRNHTFELSGWPSYTYDKIFTEGSDTYNQCGGDSGGPAIKLVDGLELVAGVNSWSEKNPGEECSSGDIWGFGGGDQSATRINGSHLNWIINQTSSQCTLMSYNSYSYQRCFDIPYINTVPEEGLMQNLATAIVSAAIL